MSRLAVQLTQIAVASATFSWVLPKTLGRNPSPQAFESLGAPPPPPNSHSVSGLRDDDMMSRAAGFRRLLTFRTLLAVAAVLALLLTLLHAQQAQAQSGGLSLAVTERSESSLTVQWSQLEDVVTYTVILLGGDEFLVHTASPGEDTYVFTGLQADFQYELSVSAFRSDATSAGEVQIRARTLPPIKPEPTPVVEPEIVPQVSVTAGPEVTEGSDAVFTITADPAPAGDITVELTITAGGDVIGDGETGQRTVTVPASGSATYAVSTVDDGVVESAGTVTATLVSASGGYAVADAPNDAATVTITSEDWLLRTPTINLARPSPGITEYIPTDFVLHVFPAPDKPLLINVRLSQENDFYYPVDLGLKQLLIPAKHHSLVHKITPIDDSVAEPDGSITLELLPGAGYQLGPYKSTTEVIIDRDLTEEERKNYTPEIQVVGTVVTGGSYEGSDYRFRFTSKRSLSSPLPITVEISQIGDFVTPEHLGKRQLTIPAAPSHAYLIVPTVDDQVDEPNGRVVARVLPGDGYVAAGWYDGEEHSGSDYGSQWIQDNDEVEFTLATGTDISEGGEAEFTISASESSPARTETIKALVSQNGDFVGASNDLGLRTLTITTGQSITLRVATDDDSADEADGWVSLSIEGAAAQVGVSDDDGGQVPQAGDCAADVSTTCPARVDGKVSGVLDSGLDEDWHGVNLTAGRTYWMKAWGFEAGVYCIHDAQGDCTQERRGYLGDGLVFTPEQSGTWFIGVRPSGIIGPWPPTPTQPVPPGLLEVELQSLAEIAEYEKAYVLEVTTVTDDYPADATTTGQLSADGSAATGRNETRVDVDWFRVSLSTGVEYYIYADSTLTKSGLAHPLHVRVEGVYDSGGSLVASGVESPLAAAAPDAVVTPDSDGAYYVAVTGNQYNYRLARHPAADLSETSFIDTPYSPGSSFTAPIEYATCLLTALDCYGSFWGLSLGNGVESSDWHNGGVPYQLSVVTGEDDYADHRDTTASVAVGGSLTGAIDYPGDVDWVAVTLPPGSLYEFKVEGVAANGKATLPDPHFTDLLYAAGGEFGGVVRFRGMRSAVWRWSQHDVGKPVDVVNTDDMGWHRPPASRLFFPGYENIYFIGVTSAENREGVLDTGAYRVSVSIVPQDPEGDDNSTTSTLTVDGGAVEAHIDSGGDVDWFAVQLEASRNYMLGVSVHCPYTDCGWASGTDLEVKLVDANGKAVLPPGLGSDDGIYDESHEGVQIEASGTYYLVVRTGFNFHWSGQKLKYNAWASLLPDDEATDDIHTTAVLPPAVKQSKRGEIQYPGDVDWYRVTVQAGWSHTFTAVYNPAHRVTYYGAEVTPSHRVDGLFDSTGAPVYDNVYFYDKRGIKQKAYAHTKRDRHSWRELVFEPDADGVYYVAVSGSLGPYQVRHRSTVAAAVPVLSITSDTASVAEGGSAEFTLTANPAPTLDLAVSVTVSASGDYGATTGKRTVTVSTGGKATLTVATTGDDADEPDGSVTATLDTPAIDAGYKVSAAQGAATVTVSDDDGPALPVISVTSDGDVTEGTDASFTVTASPAPTLDLVVSVTVSASGDYGATTGKRTVTVSTGGKATLTVATTGDDADEPDGSVTATLDTPATDAGYKVSAAQGAVTVTVSDDDGPALPVISVTSDGDVTEGAGASFTVTANPAPDADLDVSVTVSQSDDSGISIEHQTVTIPTAGYATLTVATTNDEVDEPDGSVTVTVDASANLDYRVSSSQGTAIVVVSDDDGGYTVNQGTIARVKELASQTQHGAAHVNRWNRVLLAFGEHDGTGVTGGPMTAAEAQDMADNHSSPVWDLVVVELTALEAAAAQTPPPPPTPEVSVTAGSGVTEGGDAVFTVTASPAPTANLDVSVTVSQSGDYGATTGQRMVTIPTTGSVTITVGTTDDTTDETDGSVTATVNAGSGYTVSSTQGAATVGVADNDAAPTPVVSVSAGSGVTEGGAASFTVTASPAPAADLAVSLTVSQSGDYGATTGQRTVTIPTSGSVTLTVGTTDDTTDETDGSVTATVNAGSGYTVSSSQGAATVGVADNDDPVVDEQTGYTVDPDVIAKVRDLASQTQHGTAHVNRWNRVLVAFGEHDGAGVTGGPMTAAEAQEMADRHSSPVWDEVVTELTALEAAAAQTPPPPTPEVSISAGSGITEGGDATFTVTASPAPASNLDVSVTVSQSGDYGATTGQRTVTIPTTGSVTLTVGTTDDSTDETDGSVTATVNAGIGYTVSSTQGAATVAVSDNDDAPTPVVSVTAGSGVTEGGDATFTVTASPAPTANLDVSVTVSQSGDYGATTGQRTVTVPTTGSVTLTVGTTDDSTDETDGSVTATVNAGSGYTVSSSQGAATVGVADNDAAPTPVVSVTAGSGVTEGGDASFTVTASPAPASNLAVSVTVATTGDYGATTGQRTVTVPTTGSVTLTVGTTDDTTDETDGSVTATVNAGSGYTVSSTQGTATVGVADNDAAPTPVVSVTAGSGVTEGGDAVFTVTASPAPASNLDVSVTVSQSGDYGATTGQRTVTVPTTGSVTFTVGTTDDDVDETDGSVTATVNAGSGYTVSSSQGAAMVGVADNDDAPTPVVSVSAGSGVTEGGDAVFTVTASPAPAANLDVSVTVSQSGDYGATTGQRTVTIPTTGSVTLTVGTTDDSADETDGSVTATVNAGSGYTVSSTQGAATVGVSDNDDAAPEVEITVTVEAASAVEGDVLEFRVRLSEASTEEIRIRWNTAPAYHLLDDRAHMTDYQYTEGELVFAPGVTELMAEVWLEYDDDEEPDEYFVVEAYLPGTLYPPDAVGTMTIVDDD